MYLTTSKNDHRLTWTYTCSLTAIVVRFRAITVKIFTLHDFVYPNWPGEKHCADTLRWTQRDYTSAAYRAI